MNLNVGGIIGAVLAIAGGLALIFLAQEEDGDGPRRIGKFVMLCGFVGGFVGNFLWSMVFGSGDEETDSEEVGLEDA